MPCPAGVIAAIAWAANTPLYGNLVCFNQANLFIHIVRLSKNCQ